MPVVAHLFDGTFSIEFLLQPTQGLFNGFTFFDFYFTQVCFTSSLVCQLASDSTFQRPLGMETLRKKTRDVNR